MKSNCSRTKIVREQYKMYHIEEDHEPIIDIETWEAAIIFFPG
jgi:hypothetical protein